MIANSSGLNFNFPVSLKLKNVPSLKKAKTKRSLILINPSFAQKRSDLENN